MRDSEPRRRATSDDVALRRQARAAITDIVQLLDPLRNRVVVIAAQARHGHADRQKLNQECERIADDIGQMRTELLLRLMDTPPSVAGHSRVVDVERAIDSLERQLAEARQALQRQ